MENLTTFTDNIEYCNICNYVINPNRTCKCNPNLRLKIERLLKSEELKMDRIIELERHVMFHAFFTINGRAHEHNIELLNRCGIGQDYAQKHVSRTWEDYCEKFPRDKFVPKGK